MQALLGALALVAGIVAGDTLQIAFGAVLGALAVAGLGVQRTEHRRLRRTAAANRALAGEPRYPPEET